ncbi:MAG: hypothetical protein OXN17_07855 [Candidatus Poribacteria bacterium]|nr:hypothetical protein [Candidatus Poribacteria bacterium]MDE0505914.1 hypothetical protein [Candidatus Poribacteria bacterium]
MKLPINKSGILDYAERYIENMREGENRIEGLVPEVKARGYLERPELIELSDWEAMPSNRHNMERNPEGFIEEMPRLSLAAQTEENGIAYLCRLHGVRVAVASAILHWFHDDDYPIYTLRALATVGVEKESCDAKFEDWMLYVVYCRRTAKEFQVDMRTLEPV